MATIDEQLNVRTEIEQAVAKQCDYTEFNPVFEDLFFSLNQLEERDGFKLEKYDIYKALIEYLIVWDLIAVKKRTNLQNG